MQLSTTTNSLEAFLQQPNIETSPAWEFIHGQPLSKLSIPQTTNKLKFFSFSKALENFSEIYRVALGKNL